MAASEVAPFAKTGGLGDVTSALSSYLHRAGHDVRVFHPLYATLDRGHLELFPVEFLQRIPLPMGPWRLSFSVYTAGLPGTELAVYFIHCPQLYGRASIYPAQWDEYLRFAFLSRAALISCQHMGWSPQVFHCNDWHTALTPVYLRTLFSWDRLFQNTKTLLTIHNLGYQGVFPAHIVGDLGLDGHASLLHQEELAAGKISFLTTGILHSDLLSTVSHTYAQEIQTPEQGMGLDSLLRQRRDSLIGIVNGIDDREWSPEHDAFIPHRFTSRDLTGKEKMKLSLLERMGLPRDAETPLAGVVSRLIFQKGFDLFADVLPPLLARGRVRLVVVGTGEARYVELFRWLERTFPESVAFHNGYSNELAHWVEAGSDLFLMPSRYEPCGLNQMYSLRYGTVPVVRRTGGLADTVEPFDPAADRGTGFVFDHFNSAGLARALGFALETYEKDPAAWRRLMLRGMAQDFSWERRGREYIELYQRLTGLA
jgi:starch synthase